MRNATVGCCYFICLSFNSSVADKIFQIFVILEKSARVMSLKSILILVGVSTNFSLLKTHIAIIHHSRKNTKNVCLDFLLLSNLHRSLRILNLGCHEKRDAEHYSGECWGQTLVRRGFM